MAEADKKIFKKLSYQSRQGSCKECCQVSKVFKKDDAIDGDDCSILQEDLDEVSFSVPRIDELSTSDDSGDDDSSVYYDDSFVLSSLATAIQKEYIRSLPRAKLTNSKRLGRQGISDYKALNSYVSLSKSWPAESELDKTQNFQTSTKSMEQRDLSQNGYGDTIQVNSLDRNNFRSKAVDATLLEFDQRERIPPMEKEPDKLKHKICCYLPPEFLKVHYYSSVSYPYFDLPKNALVLYLGSIKMTVNELQCLDLTRCIQRLLSKQYLEFVLLKIKNDQFVIEYCGDSGSRKVVKSKTSSKRKRKKSLPGNGETTGKENQRKQPTKDNFRNEESRSHKKGLFSCMGFSSSSKYQPLLQHNDSINLKAYEALRRKKVFEFQFQRIIFCGAGPHDSPKNMLVWVYHVVRGNYSAVECHSIECDDQYHARSLGRALSNEIVTSSVKTQ